jgi:hypothetical protein
MHIYLITYDNGESYEDYDKYPILACRTMKHANEVLAKMNAWVERAKANRPPDIDYDADAELIESQEAFRREYVASLKPPYHIPELVRMATDRYLDYQKLTIEKLPLVK